MTNPNPNPHPLPLPLPTTITAIPDQPVIEITREFDAPAAALFRAHTDRDTYAKWIGDETLKVTDLDAAPGGRWRYVVTLPDGTAFAFHGVYHTVRPDALIIHSFEFDQAPDQVGLSTLRFTEAGGRSQLHQREVYPSVEARDQALASDMAAGLEAAFARLDALVAGVGTSA